MISNSAMGGETVAMQLLFMAGPKPAVTVV